MTSEEMVPGLQSPQRRDQDLDRRYGAIGISAVAAAVRYQSAGKNPALTRPVDERFEQAA